MNIPLLVGILTLGCNGAFAGSLLDTFSSGANQFTMEFVTIGNPGNAADTTGSPNPVGSVAYTYNLGKYEVSRGMINNANTLGNLGITMYDMGGYGFGDGNGVNRPAMGISWYEAAKFVNWLNTNQGFQAAYKFDGSGKFQLWSSTDAGYNASNLFRNSLAKYVLPSTSEWYKAAYGSPTGTWYDYPTGSNSAPGQVWNGTAANTAVYQSHNVADITSAGGLSAYGTMAQGGNAWELTETAYDGSNDIADDFRELRGGAFRPQSQAEYELSANGGRYWNFASDGDYFKTGFRVASVPEPSALSLLAVGLSGLALFRRRK
jgi:formylglycine-generating enzyme required for sulfatase activity